MEGVTMRLMRPAAASPRFLLRQGDVKMQHGQLGISAKFGNNERITLAA
jgi:hypothetical protein